MKSQQSPKWSIKIKFTLSLFLTSRYFYVENYVDNCTAVSTSQKCYTQITIHFLRVLLFERNFFFVEKISHFLTLNTLITFCPWRKHLTIVKHRSRCLNGQQPIGKIHIMRLTIQLIFASYMKAFNSALKRDFINQLIPTITT